MCEHGDIPVSNRYNWTRNVFIAHLVLEGKNPSEKVGDVVLSRGMSYELSFITFHF